MKTFKVPVEMPAIFEVTVDAETPELAQNKVDNMSLNELTSSEIVGYSSELMYIGYPEEAIVNPDE